MSMPFIGCWPAGGSAGTPDGGGMAGAIGAEGATSTRIAGAFFSVPFFATFFAAGFFGDGFTGIDIVMPGVFI